ncbi:hypothetical protein AGMMS49990_06070 [Endomicrobiia bacterium]|nr:hypothetical protein AGMMS49990_06070 [Endomicrobiia bacterium]
MVIDIFLVISVVLIAWLGCSAGLVRAFFAVLAGFMATFVSANCSYQEGLNVYLVFLVTALFVIMLGALILRLVSFFYLNILDRLGGALLSVCVWLIVSINILIPTITRGTHKLDKSTSTIYTAISDTIQSKIPIFTDYVPPLLERKVVKRQK